MEIMLKLNKRVWNDGEHVSFYAGKSVIGVIEKSGKKYVFNWNYYDRDMPATFRDVSPKVKKTIIKKLEAEYKSKLEVLKEHNLTSVSWRADIEF